METRAKSSRCLLLNMLSLCGNSSSDGGPNGVQMANRASGGSSVFRFWPCNTLMRPRMSSLCQTKNQKKYGNCFRWTTEWRGTLASVITAVEFRAGDTFCGRLNKKRRNRRQRKKNRFNSSFGPKVKQTEKTKKTPKPPEVLELITGRRETRRVILAAAFSCFPRSDSVGSTARKSANESK